MIASIDSLSFGYREDQPIFRDFNLKIKAAERWAVLGPSGCGKSSLLLLLAGILKPDAGEIKISGKTLQRPQPKTGLILQDYGLLPWATVWDNAALGLKLHKFYGPDGKHAPREGSTKNSREQVGRWLTRLGLDQIADRYPAQISGGQQQRTAIARSLTLEPDLLLMDEPFGSLDSPTSSDLQELVIELNREDHLAVVLVTHSVETAVFLGQKILVLGNPPDSGDQVLSNPGSGSDAYRASAEYHELCQRLRAQLEGSL